MMTPEMLLLGLQTILDRTTLLHLYAARTNDGTYTEVQGGGYTVEALDRGEWSFNTAQGIALAESPVKTFRFDGTARFRVAGAYLTTQDGKRFWEQPFPQPIDVGRRGDLIPVRVIMALGEQAITPALA